MFWRHVTPSSELRVRRNLSKLIDRRYDPVSRFIHLSLLLQIAIASLSHLVLRSDSCPNTFTWSQSIMWFSLVAWSVMADLFCCSSADLVQSKPTRISIYILTLFIWSGISSASSRHYLTEARLSSQNKRIVSRNCSLFRQPFQLAVIQSGAWIGTNRIHGKKCMISRQIFKMCQISRKIHGRSLGNSREIHGPHRRYFEVLC